MGRRVQGRRNNCQAVRIGCGEHGVSPDSYYKRQRHISTMATTAVLNHQTTDRSCAVKYCGGCNPHYDREQAVREIEARIGKKLVRACVGETYDVLYVVCGCPSRCADISGLCADRIVMIDTANVSNQISNSIGSKNYDF